MSELKKEIARRNEAAQKAAQTLRAERERQLLARRREWDRQNSGRVSHPPLKRPRQLSGAAAAGRVDAVANQQHAPGSGSHAQARED